MLNNITLIGRLTANPELRYIGEKGTAVSRFTLAVNRSYKNKDGVSVTDFIPIEIFGKSAEFCAKYLSKGKLVNVNGYMAIDKYEDKNGNRRSSAKVSARNVNLLEWDRNKTNQTSEKTEEASFIPVEDEIVPF